MAKFRAPTQDGAVRRQHSLEAYSAASVTGPPADTAPPEHWAAYVQAAQGKAAEAFIEWGRRIEQAHQAYNAQGQTWGRTWDDWCQQNLNLSRAYANKLRAIAGNLALTKSDILPANTDSLYELARVRRDAPAVFEQRVAEGAITPSMSRAAVRALVAETLPAPAPRRRSAAVSLRVDAQVAELLQERATQEGVSVDHLLMELLMKP